MIKEIGPLGVRYFENGLLHRDNGPAWIKNDGTVEYYINGIQVDENYNPIIIEKENSVIEEIVSEKVITKKQNKSKKN